jgi:hypothetical protein
MHPTPFPGPLHNSLEFHKSYSAATPPSLVHKVIYTSDTDNHPHAPSPAAYTYYISTKPGSPVPLPLSEPEISLPFPRHRWA